MKNRDRGMQAGQGCEGDTIRKTASSGSAGCQGTKRRAGKGEVGRWTPEPPSPQGVKRNQVDASFSLFRSLMKVESGEW